MKVVTRFAPSPTGKLHIGGARTALFNFLFAKYHSGDFLVRIENTDKNRSTIENVNSIIDSLNWLNLNPSQKIIFQTENFQRHQSVAFELLDKGFAYKCYLTENELEKLRIESRKTGIPIRSPYRNKNSKKKHNNDFVIRLKMPSSGETIINDKVQGKVKINNQILDDMVLLRKDKTPTYMLASVVDDYIMGISHIIRGDDHFNNAFRQIQIIKYLNWPIPEYTHIPLIHGQDGAKLSKRHGAKNLIEYREMGFDPIALKNYLLLLGYSFNSEKIYNFNEDIFKFELKKINKSPSRFDEIKLINVNSNFLKKADLSYLVTKIVKDKNLKNKKLITNLSYFLPELVKRYKLLNEIESDLNWMSDEFIINKEENPIELKNKNNLKKISEVYQVLSTCDWELNNIKTSINKYIKDNNLMMKDVAPLIRLATTGKFNTPDIFNILYILGKENCLNRLKNCL